MVVIWLAYNAPYIALPPHSRHNLSSDSMEQNIRCIMKYKLYEQAVGGKLRTCFYYIKFVCF